MNKNINGTTNPYTKDVSWLLKRLEFEVGKENSDLVKIMANFARTAVMKEHVWNLTNLISKEKFKDD